MFHIAYMLGWVIQMGKINNVGDQIFISSKYINFSLPKRSTISWAHYDILGNCKIQHALIKGEVVVPVAQNGWNLSCWSLYRRQNR